jgi:hypothetical protein
MTRLLSNPDFCLRLWFVYPLLFPFYLMGKTLVPGKQNLAGGVPQIGDYYLVALMALAFTAVPVRLVRPAIAIVAVFA